MVSSPLATMKRGEGKFDKYVDAIANENGKSGIFVTKLEKGQANYIMQRVWKEHGMRVKISPSMLGDKKGWLFEKTKAPDPLVAYK